MRMAQAAALNYMADLIRAGTALPAVVEPWFFVLGQDGTGAALRTSVGGHRAGQTPDAALMQTANNVIPRRTVMDRLAPGLPSPAEYAAWLAGRPAKV